MSRVDEIRAKYEAELAIAELEDELLEGKLTGAELSDVKARLREARRVFRLQREGDAAASPETIQVTATVDVARGA